jgi:hypothetical protein
MKMLRTTALVLVAFSGPATAAPTCTDWMWQPSGGYYWRTCVDDNGRQYCERMYNNYITRVACS